MDKIISANYFENLFMDTFGSIAYVLDFCGIYFSGFVFIKLVLDLIVMVLRQIEINRLAGASLGVGKTLQSASYILISTSIPTSIINPQAPLLQELEPKLTPTRLEDETRDPIDENEKKEEHFYPIVHHPTTLSPLFD